MHAGALHPTDNRNRKYIHDLWKRLQLMKKGPAKGFDVARDVVLVLPEFVLSKVAKCPQVSTKIGFKCPFECPELRVSP